MKNIEIAKKLKISPMFASYLMRNKRHTTRRSVAIGIAEFSKKTPIEHVSPPLRKAYLTAYPELGKKIKIK